MKRKKTKRELWTKERREQFDRNTELLRERIEFHRAKLIEENPGWDPPKTEEEWAAYHEARLEERIRASDQK